MTAIRWLVRLVSAGVLLLWLAGAGVMVSLPPANVRPGIGNFPEVVDRIDAPREGTLRVAFLGDVNNVGVANLAPLLRECRERRPHLLIFGGDLIAGDGTEWKHRFTLDEIESVRDLPPIVVAPGNHDVVPDREVFRRIYGPGSFRFHCGPALVTILDGTDPDEAEAEDLGRAAADRRPGEPILVVRHVPLDTHEQRLLPALTAAVEALPAPAVVLSGHFHGYWEFGLGAATQVVAGGAPDREGGTFDARPVTFLDVDPGGIRWESPTVRLTSPVYDRVRFLLMRNVEKAMRLQEGGLWWLAATVVCWTLWLLLEWRDAARRHPEAASGAAESPRRMTFWKHANRDLRFVLLLMLLTLPLWNRLAPDHMFACYLFVSLGAAVRIWANGVIDKGQTVCDVGPYSLLRHPMYLGTLFLASGYLLLWDSPAVWIASLALLVFLEIWRAKLEEARLGGRFGADYAEYRLRVPLAFPWPWTAASAVRSGRIARGFEFRRLWSNGEVPRILAGAVVLYGFWIYYDFLSDERLQMIRFLNDEGVEMLLGILAVGLGYLLGRSLPNGLGDLREMLRRRAEARATGREAWKENPPPDPRPPSGDARIASPSVPS